MRKLFHAGMKRLWKSRIFHAEVAAMALWSAVILYVQNKQWREYGSHVPTECLLFSGFNYIGIAAAVFCSLFVGTEYSDGTIRNKIVVGHRRADIYASNAILCSFAGVFSSVVAMALSGAAGVLLFGKFTVSFRMLSVFVLDYILVCIAYASLFNLTAMLCANRTYTAIINIMGAFLFLFVGIYLYKMLDSPEMMPVMSLKDGEVVTDMVANPGYLRGMRREIYQFLFDFLPGGQALQIANLDAPHPYRIMLCALFVTAVSNAAGMFSFRRKDIR